MVSILLQKNVPCMMRDGITLYADIYRPDQPGTYPVLLTRLPYGKDNPFYSHRYLDTNRLVEQGYVVIIQDVRGRFQSEGKFYPFLYEAIDGYETVEWAANLPFSSGKVGMFGLSYYGYTQLLAAKAKPPHLKAIFPAMTLNNFKENMIRQDGICRSAPYKTWVIESILPDLIRRKYQAQRTYQAKMNQWVQMLNDLAASLFETTIEECSIIEDLGVGERLKRLVSLPDEDVLWDETRITDDYHQLQIPAYHLAGWYDSLLQPTLENYQQMAKQTGQPQRLIIGPWTHGDFSGIAGERSFGIHASAGFLNQRGDLTNLHIRWFNYWLKGISEDITEEPPIKLFVMGINQWRYEESWPLVRTAYVPYYFHSKGEANSRFGDGKLNKIMPDEEPVDSFIHDPLSPVPTNGGQTLFYGVHTSGAKDQRWIEEREDMLVFTTAPLEEPTEVTGPIKVTLWVTSSATSADFNAKLVDVHPDETAYNLTDGISRVEFPTGNKNQHIRCVEIALPATSNVFLPGHSIRVEIASSNYPQYDVNPNIGTTLQQSREAKFAKQTIFHCRDYPSHIVLPIV
ncbi:CocE/NonD family hydrolase [Virgibacillus pantothenticus]|uniref:CocE/NonD family hydrolase n=1 Tax=Virgibacillus pantothenticus TaxID=1473 RepID=UPI001C247DFB|nr:CocE/NonD family hydrolase [Virgibacillus pantothenticus]MBU8568346.1 CocE/NonD family hydrolase [Virgibacillus pantothenticus]MBU8602381.1 CocE/NonD family hydrolase [Virgibacillus pantothenticus]MBU8636516.1 CocE/NonD family hydrolase [Virgibacillus pantothenticus]MBU8641993.1 CocE/NonD family hydrolase [Virgibacillus pantothenticus]MBU8645777.1 CocE/NonD family hydrolase [Virgibacillus pantothenticus]